MLAELPHWPENRDPALDPDFGAKALQSGRHGRRIGIVALVDQQDIASIDMDLVPLATPFQAAEIAQLKRLVGNMGERLREIADNPVLAEPPEPPPPHY